MDWSELLVKISSASNRKEIRSGSWMTNSTAVSSVFLQDFFLSTFAFLNRSSSHLDKESSFQVIRLMAIKGFTEWSTRHAILTCEKSLSSGANKLYFFPPKITEQSHRFGWMQQGDINVNVQGTLTAFNPDLSHTSLSKMFLLKTAFCCSSSCCRIEHFLSFSSL